MKFRIPLALAFLLASTPAMAEQVRRCAINMIDGSSVQLSRGGAVIAVMPGVEIENADRIVTGPQTRLTIQCGDGMRIAIAGGTDIDIGTLMGAAASEGYAARLLRGLAGFILPLIGDRRFEVRTPSAVASVRSTEWSVEVVDDATAVFVRKGAVAVTAEQGVVAELTLGKGIDVTADGVAGPVKNWGEGRVDDVAQRLGAGWR